MQMLDPPDETIDHFFSPLGTPPAKSGPDFITGSVLSPGRPRYDRQISGCVVKNLMLPVAAR
jgi:hypothetical protein